MDRQDRYVIFKDCKNLADFFTDIVNTTLSHSYTLDQDGSSTQRPSALSYDPLKSRKTAESFRYSLGEAIKKLTSPIPGPEKSSPLNSMGALSGTDFDTVVYPLLQMQFCGIRQDEEATQRIFEGMEGEDSMYLATGYFNLPPIYSKSILQSRGEYNILAAAPKVSSHHHHHHHHHHPPTPYDIL